MSCRALGVFASAAMTVLSGCDKSGGDCGICEDMASKCGWADENKSYCLRTCQQSLPHSSRCESSYDAALACFSNADSWSCIDGLVGCQAELNAYDDCRVPPWTPIADLPKSVRGLVQDPRTPRTVYAATGMNGSGGGVYQSTDAGKTWSRLSGTFPGVGSYLDVTALTVTSQGQLIAAVSSNVFTSTDAGKTWTQVSTARVSESRDVDRLVVASTDAQVLYGVVDEDGFVRSEDGGKTWKKSNQGLPVETYGPGMEIVYTQALAVDPSNPSTVYLGTGRSSIANGANGVFKSIDRGGTWSAANKGILELRATSLLALSSAHLVVATDEMGMQTDVIYESDDAGQSWRSFYQRPDSSPYGVVQLASAGGQIYALLQSLDLLARSGDGWQTLLKAPKSTSGMPPTVMGLVSLVVIPEAKPIYLVGTTSGAYRYVEE